MRFKDFYINEVAPIGIKHNKEIWLDYLKEKYSKNPDDLYITFVFEDKVGINPKTIYDTPIGVYTYPMSYVLDEEDVPFRGEGFKARKVKVLKATNDKKLSNNLSNEEYKKCIEYIKSKKEKGEYYFENSIDVYIKNWEQNARVKTNFGKLWNVTRNFTMDKYRNPKVKELKNNISAWTKLLIELGFDYAVDIDDDGIIHPSEPTQAVFFNPKSYKVIDETFVDTEERYKESQDKFSKEFISKIQKGKWDKQTILDILKMKKFQLLKLTDDLDRNALSYVMGSHNKELFNDIVKYFVKDDKLEDKDVYVDILMRLMNFDFDFFKYITDKYYIKNGKLEYFKKFFNYAMSMLSLNKKAPKSLQYLIDMENEEMFNELPQRKFLAFMNNVYDGNKKEKIMKMYEKYLKDSEKSLDGLEAALKDDKK